MKVQAYYFSSQEAEARESYEFEGICATEWVSGAYDTGLYLR